MDYPTIEEVNNATHLQICKWHRFLTSPSTDLQIQIMDRVCERLKEFGGFTPEISKKLGW